MVHTRYVLSRSNGDGEIGISPHHSNNNDRKMGNNDRLHESSLFAATSKQEQQHNGSLRSDNDTDIVVSRPGPSVVFSKMKLGEEDLGFDYVPSNYDIMCGRGNFVDNQIGNRRFRVLISLHLQKYFSATRHEKTYIVISIVDTTRAAGGRFVQKDPKTHRWYDIGDEKARAKVGNALRDAARLGLSRSSQTKSARKDQEKEDQIVSCWF